MSTLNEGNTVKVVDLKEKDRFFLGSEGVKRAPKIGDEAEVTDVHMAADGKQTISAELVEDGKLIWLAKFNTDELRKVDFVDSKN